MQKADGKNYAPTGKASPVCGPGEFRFAAVGLDHGHIYGMCNGLVEAGGELAWLFDPDPQKVAAFCATYNGVKVARSEAEVLEDPAIRLIASATVPCRRGPLGLRVMDCRKHYFADKPPVTSLDQLNAARAKVAETGGIYAAQGSPSSWPTYLSRSSAPTLWRAVQPLAPHEGDPNAVILRVVEEYVAATAKPRGHRSG